MQLLAQECGDKREECIWVVSRELSDGGSDILVRYVLVYCWLEQMVTTYAFRVFSRGVSSAGTCCHNPRGEHPRFCRLLNLHFGKVGLVNVTKQEEIRQSGSTTILHESHDSQVYCNRADDSTETKQEQNEQSVFSFLLHASYLHEVATGPITSRRSRNKLNSQCFLLFRMTSSPRVYCDRAYRHYCSIDPSDPQTRNAAIQFKKNSCWPGVRIHFVGVWYAQSLIPSVVPSADFEQGYGVFFGSH